MTKLLNDKDFNQLKGSLPPVFRDHLKNDEAILAQAYPLLDRICNDRELMERFQTALKIPEPPSGQEMTHQIMPKFQALVDQFQIDALFPYRLPIVLSEFPLHSRAINKCIASFNELVAAYHRKQSNSLAKDQLTGFYNDILKAIKEHGPFCDAESLWQILGLLAGWSKISPIDVYKRDKPEPIAGKPEDLKVEVETSVVAVHELKQATHHSFENPFVPDYNYNINGAGRLATETNFLLLNAFGMKIGGHFDAQVKYPPRFIPLEQLHAMMRRQLLHRMEVKATTEFQLWLEITLHQLGVELIQRNEGELSKNVLVNPFFKEPISFLSPEKINLVLKQTLTHFDSQELNSSESELDILAQYLFELLQGFQINPGQALGIGANWDGTINLSNEAGAEPFKFSETHAEWGRRFKQLSLHRQGPSEAKMNAAVGIKFEAQSILSSFDYMSQLQPTEYSETLYNALIDNLITDLFPEPAYFENPLYKKYKKHHVVNRSDASTIKIDSFYQSSNQGTYFKDKEGHEKQTPMYRRAGTLDVQAFPKNSNYCEQSRVCYEGNPLGPLQLQYAQAMHRTTRGHIVYDPIDSDQFIEDAFYGQVLCADNGDYLPFIGVMPKNFDRHFKQSSELCASFVIRMLQSAHIIEYCPTFKEAYEQLKTRFLPPKASKPPALPKFCSEYLFKKLEELTTALASDKRNFSECQSLFYSIYKNLIYSLYDLGQEDEHFKHSFLSLIHYKDTFYPISKAKCDKLIRDFTINRPVNVSPDALARYDEMMRSLKDLSTYFYPRPSDALAQSISTLARRQIKALLQSPSIKIYFESLQNNKQTNLSRKQTPGMLFAALKHNGPSKTVAKDYKKMHEDNFPSYYRDPDGTPNGEPQTQDKLMDWGAKTLGASLQLMHKYHPWAFIHKPISEPIVQARIQAASHQFDESKPLWVTKGLVEGFFWNGMLIGLWESTTTPFIMMGDLISWQHHLLKKKRPITESNPLEFSAAPANESNVKVLASAHSRDYLLQMLGNQNSIVMKKEELFNYMTQLAKKLYPYLTESDLLLFHQQLLNSIPLSEANWDTLFNSSFNLINNKVLLALLQKYNPCINRSLIQAVFQCVTNPLFVEQPEAIINTTQSAFALSSKQNKALKDILDLYEVTSSEKKQNFIDLFRFRGTIHTALQTRDQLLQKIQNSILKVFNEQWILELLFDNQIDKITSELTPLTLNATLLRLPNCLKWPLKQLLVSNNPKTLEDYTLTEKQLQFLTKVHNLFNQIAEQASKEHCLTLCYVETQKDESTLSVKDKAHNKWARFAEKELKHLLLSADEAKDLLITLVSKLKENTDLISQIAPLKQAYLNLAIHDDKTITTFYDAACGINNQLIQLISMEQPDKTLAYREASIIVCNFIDVTMNAVVNTRLDRIEVDLFKKEIPPNPLLSSKVIASWLTGVQHNNRNLRSLLEQQVQQSHSLDHALWRCKSIVQVLEQQKPKEKIAKTGMQSLLRFWSQHRENVTITGERYTDSSTGEANKASYATLFKDSPTLEHALKRVQEKLSVTSLFRRGM